MSLPSLCCSGRKHAKLICKKNTMIIMEKKRQELENAGRGPVEVKERVIHVWRVAEATVSTKA